MVKMIFPAKYYNYNYSHKNALMKLREIDSLYNFSGYKKFV